MNSPKSWLIRPSSQYTSPSNFWSLASICCAANRASPTIFFASGSFALKEATRASPTWASTCCRPSPDFVAIAMASLKAPTASLSCFCLR